LGLDVESLVKAVIDGGPVAAIASAGAEEVRTVTAEIESIKSKVEEQVKIIASLQARLAAPQRAYQTYLKAEAKWQEQRRALVGSGEDPESLAGLKAALGALDALPGEITKAREQQRNLALEIHEEKRRQADLFRRLYGPVQDFLSAHPLAAGRLGLEFRAELGPSDVGERLLDLLNLSRRGSFMGLDEGRARIERLTQTTAWEDSSSVSTFRVQLGLRPRLRASTLCPSVGRQGPRNALSWGARDIASRLLPTCGQDGCPIGNRSARRKPR
jgi:hypothetical protein